MTKHSFTYLAVILLAGIAIWFFMRKSQNISQDKKLNDIRVEETSSAVSPSPNASPNKATEDEWTELEGGLKYLDVIVGTGQEAQPGNMIFAHYNGTLEDGTKFDNSYDRGQPFSFTLGSGQVIKGWDLGIVGMKVGGKRKLVIPSEMAYGNREVGGGLIPANSTLYFDVELVTVQGDQ